VAALGNDRVLIGAPGDDVGANSAGVAYLFAIDGRLLTTFTNPAPAANDQFGFAVAAAGTDRVVIGANSDDAGATDAGAAYLFSTDGTLLMTFTNPTPTSGAEFGNAVAAVGSDRVLIGAHFDDAGATNTGVAYLFCVDSYVPGLVAEAVRVGGVSSESIAAGAVTSEQLAVGSVGANQLAPAA